GVRLLYESRALRHRGGLAHAAGQLLHTPVGRIAAGMLLAQGLAYSLQLLCHAYLQAATEEVQVSIWSTLYGLVLLQTIQGVSLLAGGALAGVGQRRAAVLGAVVGALHSSIFLVVLRIQSGKLTDIALYGQPVLHIILGMLGAVIGSSVWQPL